MTVVMPRERRCSRCCAGGVGPVADQRRRPGPGTARSAPWHRQAGKQRGEHRGVTGLTRADEDDQRPAAPVDDGMGLGAQPTTRTTDAVIVWFVPQIKAILVIRRCPLCARTPSTPTSGPSHRAHAPGRSWNQPTPSSRYDLRHRPAHATQSRPCPGNSGSAVVDLSIDGSRIIGLHFGSPARKENWSQAVARVQEFRQAVNLSWV